MIEQNDISVGNTVTKNLPFLRRYGRALTGNQSSGDRFAAATLEVILEDMALVARAADPRAAIFHTFHALWKSAGAPVGHPDSPLAARAQDHMARLTPNSREALLLHVIEGFTVEQIAGIIQQRSDDVTALITVAIAEMEASVSGAVLVIEDEAIIAMDIVDIVRGSGHRVTGTAPTHKDAVVLARRDPPDLILADIQLADKSSGIEAVNEILSDFPQTPVIFITAFPERMLSGARPEPAFVITKPFTEEQLRSAVGQAMFFASTQTLSA
jgi:CheY-like chemotaxis protein